MTEEQQQPVEAVQEEREETVSETGNIQNVSETPKSNAEINWDLARQILASQKAEIDELKARIDAPSKIPEGESEEEDDEFEELADTEYITVAQAKKLREKAEKSAEKKAKIAVDARMGQYSQKKRVDDDEDVCKKTYDDYEYILENFSLPVMKKHPVLAMQTQRDDHPAQAAYWLGKNSPEYKAYMAKQTSSPKAEKTIKNSQRPVSSAAVPVPLKGQAETFSGGQSKADVWKESQKYARQA